MISRSVMLSRFQSLIRLPVVPAGQLVTRRRTLRAGSCDWRPQHPCDGCRRVFSEMTSAPCKCIMYSCFWATSISLLDSAAVCTCSSGGWKSTFSTYRSGTFVKCWQFILFYSFCFESPTFAVLPSSPAWKKCLEYELCGLQAFEVAPATFDLLPAVEGNICAWETRRGNEHTGLCYLKSRLIYNHVNGGQVSVFFFT